MLQRDHFKGRCRVSFELWTKSSLTSAIQMAATLRLFSTVLFVFQYVCLLNYRFQFHFSTKVCYRKPTNQTKSINHRKCARVARIIWWPYCSESRAGFRVFLLLPGQHSHFFVCAWYHYTGFDNRIKITLKIKSTAKQKVPIVERLYIPNFMKHDT